MTNPNRLACALCLVALALATALPTASAQRPADAPRRTDAPQRTTEPSVQRPDKGNGHDDGHNRRRGHGDDAGMRAQLDSLDLSEAQRTEIAVIVRKHKAASRVNGQPRGDNDTGTATDPDPAARKAAADARRAAAEQLRAEINAVLTPTQREQLEARVAERRAARDADRASHDARRADHDADRASHDARRAAHDADRASHDARRAELAPMRDELRAYHKEKVRPAMAELRQDFDRKLTADERASIDRLRAVMDAERASKRAEFAKLRQERAGADPRPGVDSQARPYARRARGEAMRAEREAFRQAHKADFAAVEATAKAHEADLQVVRDEFKRHETIWRADLVAIQAKYLSAEEIERNHTHEVRRGSVDTQGPRGDVDVKRHEDKKPHHGDAERSSEYRADRRAMGFLLMDPAGDEDFDDGLDPDLDDPQRGDENGFRVFPNPAGSETQVAVDVRVAGPVQVELINANGQVVRQLYRQNHEKGPLQLSLDLGEQTPNTNVIRITDGAGVRTQVLARQ